MSLEAVCVVLMAKFPDPGRVKTRLGAALTPVEAAQVYRIFLLHVARRLDGLKPAELVICYDPPDAGSPMRELIGPLADATYLPQSGRDLGGRIADARATIARLHRRTLFLGVDSPDVPDDHLHRAAVLTDRFPISIGPTGDGGYWFLGLSGDVDVGALLEGVNWSSGREARQTLEHAEALGYASAIGDRWEDVDRPEDLERLLGRLAASSWPADAELFRELCSVAPQGMLRRGVQS